MNLHTTVSPLTLIRVADCETTGFPPDAEMVEIGWTDIRLFPTGWEIEGESHSRFVNPGHPIPSKVSAIHGITDDMVVDGMDPDAARRLIYTGPDYLCAHNAAFDSKFLRGHMLPWICTLKCARKMWPNMPNHKNETIRQELGITVEGDAHRAGYDAAVTARILLQLLKIMPLESMFKVSRPDHVPLRMPFGKNKGKKFTEISASDLRWIISSDMEEGIKIAARAALDKFQAVASTPVSEDPDAWRKNMEPF